MCVIIINQTKKKIDIATLKRSATINPDGLGVLWLDDYSIEYYDSKEYMTLYTERPFIGHFRYATVGKVGRDNTHPFSCGNEEFLFHNGTINGLGNEEVCDSREFAQIIGRAPRKQWASRMLAYNSRFVSANVKTKSFQIYNKDLWTRRDGVWFSKNNVFPRKAVRWSPTLFDKDSFPSKERDSLVGVYGTLKTGQHNNHYLSDSLSLGLARTSDEYPLIISGLPYLIDEAGVGFNVEVEVFSINEKTLARLDRLEGHPTWYRRQRTLVKMEDSGDILSVWIYFNIKESFHGKELHHRYPADESNKNACLLCDGKYEFDGFYSYRCSDCGDYKDESELVVM